MIKRSLKDVQSMVNGQSLKEEYNNCYIEGVSTDSRQIKDNQLFIPLIGENFNGHEFINQIVEKGAVATLWNKDEPLPNIDFPFILVDDTLSALQQLAKEYRSQLNLKIIGITGSNGKTTTKDIIASLLNTKYKTKKTMGNLNNLIGTPLTILDLNEDTEMAVIEMATDKFGELSILTSIVKPDIAIITSIGEAHLEDLLTKENVLKAKLEILEGLNKNGLFIYFGDDPIIKKELKNYDIHHKTLTYGTEEQNDYQCTLDKMGEKSLSFTLNTPKFRNFSLPMLGKHNMYNATASIIVAQNFNIDFDLIQKGFYHIDKTGLRDELIYAKGFAILNDSYKSNPDSVLAALDTLYDMKNYEQKIVVLGDMLGLGEEEIKMHKKIGASINEKEVDSILTIGSLAEYIGKAAKPKYGDGGIIHCENKHEIIEELKKILKPKSLVLVKASRSMELEEVVETLTNEITIS